MQSYFDQVVWIFRDSSADFMIKGRAKMSIENYFNHGFQNDIAKLEFTEVPQVLRDILNDPQLVLFGGKNWVHAEADLKPIEAEDRPMFVLCLFAVVATDQCMQSYFKSHYPLWRSQTAYPKFGWVRFGLYNENPLKLFSVPENAKVIDTARTMGLMGEFIGFYRQLLADYCQQNAPELSVDLFFSRLLNDKIMDLEEGSLIAAFKHKADALFSGVTKPPFSGADHWLAA